MVQQVPKVPHELEYDRPVVVDGAADRFSLMYVCIGDGSARVECLVQMQRSRLWRELVKEVGLREGLMKGLMGGQSLGEQAAGIEPNTTPRGLRQRELSLLKLVSIETQTKLSSLLLDV
jgi:hypothetical protein